MTSIQSLADLLSVSVQRVRFDSAGDTLVGNLFRPTINTGSGVAVVVTGSWTTSKEQQADFYARRLAAAGVTALTFDFRGFGQSSGLPRDWEHPDRKTADIAAATRFLATVDGIDANRIGGVGICASAGYQVVNATSDARVRSLALIAPWLHNAELVAPYYGGVSGVADRIAASRRAAARYAETGTVEYVRAVSTTEPTAAMYGAYDYYLDATRGAIPEWDSRFAVMSWEPWLTFDPIAVAAHVEVPVLTVHSRDGAVPDGAQLFHDGLSGSRRLIWTGGTQLDFYDRQHQVETAIAAAVDHFATTL